MIKFQSNVQLIKFEVLKEVAKSAMENRLLQDYKKIPKRIIKGPKPRTRCCIYKERAIMKQRVRAAMGGKSNNKNIIEVLDIACDACPINRFTITEACRGCLAHRCSEACPVGAIYHVGQRAYINQNICIECGKCRDACQYNAVSDVMRPCRGSCPTGALTLDEDKTVVINDDLCVQCGICIVQCPFGAIMDKSFIPDILDIIKHSKENTKYKTYAVVAPAIVSQFDTDFSKVVEAIKELGFYDVIEAAEGADLVAHYETEEFLEKSKDDGVMTTSCCPAFVKYAEITYPQFKDNISSTVSPMIAISRLIKEKDEKAKVVFIGPCIAKKAEAMREDVKGATDFVMTFEELYAMLVAKDIKIEDCEGDFNSKATPNGKMFARSAGVTEAIKNVINKEKIDVDFKPVTCNGLKECDKAFKMLKVGRLNGNFIEGMACVDGCIGGPVNLIRRKQNTKKVNDYAKESKNINGDYIVDESKKCDLHMHR
ncbi:MAG: 4Fe-4S dicluster domain-containing protein [Anaeromicrobium sp.]|jgi:[FeFe] hydrogenase (group B1/B3)|uniref:4Fe-4S dicluster domain-containing protein n=1 Tax=Anaeromicrobium sp. TaxID=1929132 RepID=UPI0025F2CFDA|nr:4Fe-4S dicluster domain-containing protein [Anaeromicrobium sp.]MCT4594533.1 4Fe-4S dicluster domain-containing protein [Anaeromicrobium sp.]